MAEPIDVPLSIPVLDGRDPAAWPIWGKTFADACNEFYASPRNVPASFNYAERVRLTILMQPEDKLYERTERQWGRIIGLLLDGSGGPGARPQILDRALRLCAKIKPENAAYLQLKQFKVWLVLPNDAADDQEVADFANTLELQIGQRLGVGPRLGVSVYCEAITSAAELRGILRMYEKKLVRDWIVNPPSMA